MSHPFCPELSLNRVAQESPFGHWGKALGHDCFFYTVDHRSHPAAEWDPIFAAPTRRHEVGVGNRRIQMFCDNSGGVALWDEAECQRWVTAPAPTGTGKTLIDIDVEGATFGTLESDWPKDIVPERIFGPTFFIVRFSYNSLSIDRTVLAPEGEAPWVLIRVTVKNDGKTTRQLKLSEVWQVSPRLTPIMTPSPVAEASAQALIRLDTEVSANRVRAIQDLPSEEEIADFVNSMAARANDFGVEGMTSDKMRSHMAESPPFYGPEMTVLLETLDDAEFSLSSDGVQHPELTAAIDIELAPAETRTFWFRFGLDEGQRPQDPATLFSESLSALHRRLPEITLPGGDQLARELRWHTALLTGQVCVAKAGGLDGHFLPQGSLYRFIGSNCAINDTSQYLLPLIYIEPDLARSILINLVGWCDTDGKPAYGIGADGGLWGGPAEFMHTDEVELSDPGLWVLWVAAEYAMATEDWAVFDAPVAYHSDTQADPVPLRKHLRRMWRYWRDTIGIGPQGHVRLRSGDWNDVILRLLPYSPEQVKAEAESVYNSALAAWALPIFAGAMAKIGESALAQEARSTGDQLREAVRGAWNGKWFRRAIGPEGVIIGDDALWLEVQPWAMLCGAATDEQATILIDNIKKYCCENAPLGPRIRVSVSGEDDTGGFRIGTGLAGGTWNTVNMLLLWAVRDRDPEFAWQLWEQLSLANHIKHYPEQWSGTLSATDSYNSPESYNPGGAFVMDGVIAAAQTYPVNNAHAHTHLLFGLLRLMGVEPGSNGTMNTPMPGPVSWQSQAACFDPD